jgi:polysaccharide export outer membrane protein
MIALVQTVKSTAFPDLTHPTMRLFGSALNGGSNMNCSSFRMLLIFLTLFAFLYGFPRNTPAQSVMNEYRIGKGDILEIVTWKEPDFSRDEVLVRLDGRISFPLLNDIQAEGRTVLDLKKEIETKLKDYIATPIVTVTLRAPNSQKFYILGEVQGTGEYNLVKGLTVLQAFARAGGFTEWASKKEIILMRKENGQEKIYRVNYNDIIDGDDLTQNKSIQADDTIIVP